MDSKPKIYIADLRHTRPQCQVRQCQKTGIDFGSGVTFPAGGDLTMSTA